MTVVVLVPVYVFLLIGVVLFFFFKQKTAYEMRISDWSSDVCSSDLPGLIQIPLRIPARIRKRKTEMHCLCAEPCKCGRHLEGFVEWRYTARADVDRATAVEIGRAHV